MFALYRRLFRRYTSVGCCFVIGYLFYLTGCGPSAKVEIDLDMATPISQVSVDSQWAVLQWCLESDETALYKVDRDRAHAIQHQLGPYIFAKWCNSISVEFPFLGTLDGDLFFTGTIDDKSQIRNALDKVRRPIMIKPTMVECRSLLWTKNIVNSGFPLWFKENAGDMRLPENLYGDRSLAYKKLRAYSETYLAAEVISAIDQHTAKGDFKTAFDKLRDVADDFPENADLIAKLHDVGEQLVAAEIQTVIEKDLASVEDSISTFNTAAEDLAKTEAKLASVEEKVAQMLSGWQKDLYLANVVARESTGKATIMQKDIATSRARLWQREATKLIEKNYFWTAYDQLRSRLRQIEGFRPVAKDAIAQRLWKTYMENLSSCVTHFLETAKQEMENAERHGITLVLCNMADDLIAFAENNDQQLPEDITYLRRNLEDLQQRSTVFFETWVKRELILSEFTSGEAGLGTTFHRDLEILFGSNLNDSKMIYGVNLANERKQPRKQDYFLDRCNVAAFEVDKATPEEGLELITRTGEIIEEDNPEYIDRVKKKRITTGVPPKITTQKIHKYTKHISKVEVVVHTRLTFTLVHQEKEDFFEINKFLKKSFVKETIDPRETIIKTEKVAGPVEPVPVLRDDNIWVPSEMKDWARRESQNLVVFTVVRFLANYPLSLADRATSIEKKKQWQVAANFWGFCLEYCKRIDPDPSVIQAELADPNILEHTRAELQENLKVIGKLQKLQDDVWSKAVGALTAHFEPAKK